MNIFLKEIKHFSKNNWWIYIVLFICIYIIYTTNTWNIIEILLIFLLHFFADLFLMMMSDYYEKKNFKKWTIYQILSVLLFFIIWLYSWVISWKWNYLFTQLIFIWPSIKWYYKNIKNTEIKIIDYKIILFFWIIILFIYNILWLLENIWIIVQIIWFITFSIWLIINNNIKKYYFSLIWNWLITISWIIIIYKAFLLKNIIWTDISFTLLPLTVFIFYLKNLKNYI